MSSTFSLRFLNYCKYIIYDNNTLIITKNSADIVKKLSISLGICSLHGVYVFSTSENEEIKIVKKYTMDRNGFTNFMVIDNKNRHFNVNNSVWYWKWDSIEDWSTLQENSIVNVKYYGWRIPFIGLFPNIVKSSDKSLNVPSSSSAIEFDTFAILKDYTSLKRHLIQIHEEYPRKEQQ
jgi:hypothetical protein